MAPCVARSSAAMVLGVQGMLMNHGLVQERRNSSALAMELRLSCTKPSECPCLPWGQVIAFYTIQVLRNDRKYNYILIFPSIYSAQWLHLLQYIQHGRGEVHNGCISTIQEYRWDINDMIMPISIHQTYSGIHLSFDYFTQTHGEMYYLKNELCGIKELYHIQVFW